MTVGQPTRTGQVHVVRQVESQLQVRSATGESRLGVCQPVADQQDMSRVSWLALPMLSSHGGSTRLDVHTVSPCNTLFSLTPMVIDRDEDQQRPGRQAS